MKKSNVIVLEDVVSRSMVSKDAAETISNIGRKLIDQYPRDEYIVIMARKLLEKANVVDENFSFIHEAINFVVKDEGIDDAS